MKPLLLAAHYFDDGIRVAERRALWDTIWQFAGFTFDIPCEGDFIVRQIGGKSVLIQQVDGFPRAFHNVCAHRSNRLRNVDSGNGPLRCGYHGWTFGGDGTVRSFPKPGLFEPLQKDHLPCLTRWHTAVCGTLIFVSRAASPPPIASFLGPQFHRLETLSNVFGEKLDTLTFEIPANWKIPVENNLERYHVATVHPTTYERGETPETEYFWDTRLHSSIFVESRQTSPREKGRVAREKKVFDYCFGNRPVNETRYSHHFVFPNLTVLSQQGITFAVQEFQPLGAERTLFRAHLFLTKLPDLPETKQPAVGFFAAIATDFLRTVFNEDVPVFEHIQQGTRQHSAPGILNTDEIRVQEFHKAYLSLMEVSATPHAD